jgi:hypothetical protein
MAAELFCSMEQMAPHINLVEEVNYGIEANNMESDDGKSEFPHDRRHWFGTMSSIVSGTDATVWGSMPRALCPLAMASYQNGTGLIIPHVSPN